MRAGPAARLRSMGGTVHVDIGSPPGPFDQGPLLTLHTPAGVRLACYFEDDETLWLSGGRWRGWREVFVSVPGDADEVVRTLTSSARPRRAPAAWWMPWRRGSGRS
jgi:hypothetical protein